MKSRQPPAVREGNPRAVCLFRQVQGRLVGLMPVSSTPAACREHEAAGSYPAGVEDLDSIENEDLGQRIRENLLDVLTQEAATVERLTAHLHEELATNGHRGVSMIDAGVVDADEVHLGGGTDRLVVADQFGGVDIKRPACPLFGADEGTLEAEAQAVAVEIDDVHGRS